MNTLCHLIIAGTFIAIFYLAAMDDEVHALLEDLRRFLYGPKCLFAVVLKSLIYQTILIAALLYLVESYC